MDIHKVEQLLDTTHKIIVHQREKEKLRGEKFNVFSILRMERKENATHSAFLCELLNPEGTHLKGKVFLQLFLQSIGDKTIDIKSAKVKTEHHVGKKDVDEKTGGRIDIYIWDSGGYSISIENKIDASEQEDQIERYFNHNKGKNSVYYLTKFGVESEKSNKRLKIDVDYYRLSYKENITNWLLTCMKEVYDVPILRESIKQYYLLVKKLTQTMNKEEEKELFDAILNQYDEATVIASNLKSAVVQLNTLIRHKIFDLLKQRIGKKYNIHLGYDVDKSHSQIWIKVNGKDEMKIFFGIQGFSFEKDNDFGENLYIGIFVNDGKYLPEYAKLGEKRSNYWIEIQNFSEYNGYSVCFQNPKTLKRLNSDGIFQENFINHIVNETEDYLKIHHDSIDEYLNQY
jgi:hypothetical protein